jgi:transmembrane sensor
MNKDYFLYIAAKVFSGEATPEEENSIKAEMDANPSLKKVFELYQKHWTSGFKNEHSSVEHALDKLWARIRKEEEANVMEADDKVIDFATKNSNRRIWMKIAAALVLVCCLGLVWLWVNKTTQTGDGFIETVNKNGIKSTLLLPDGTKVWLAGDSKIKYPKKFSENNRNVYLNGEAFFEVERDTLKPFIVHTSYGEVTVLGTSFNVTAYEADKEVITAVATGKVSYTAPKEDAPVLLLPGKKSTYNATLKTLTVSDVIEEAEWAWTKGRVSFQADSLGKIATTLQRFFGKPVQFSNPQFRKYRYTGSFDNHTQAEILELLTRTKKFPFRVTDSTIIIGN